MKIVSEERDGFAIVRVEGRVVRENQAELRSKLAELSSPKVRGVALDFAKVDYLDSAGLGCCASVHKLLNDHKRPLVLFGATPNVERMWKLIRLDQVIPLFTGEAEAMAHLRKAAPPLWN